MKVSILNYMPRFYKEEPLMNRKDFKKFKYLEVSTLVATQDLIDFECLKRKMKGKDHSVIHVLRYENTNLILDGHHTAIAKMLRWKAKVRVKYLEYKITEP